MDAIQSVLEASPDAVIVVDADGVIRQTNRNVESVFGYPRTRLEGMPVEEFLPKSDRDQHIQYRQEYMDDPQPRPMGRELDLHALHEDGTRVPVEISLGPIKHDGEVLVVATVSDITNRKRRERELQRSEERYRRLLEHSPAPIAIYDPDGIILYANEAASDTMNVDSPDDLVGSTTLDLVHPDERDGIVDELIAATERRRPIELNGLTLLTPNDETRHVNLATTPIQYGDEDAFQVVVNDVTALKERERDLQRQNDRLDEFASIVSHDLRTPLGVAKGRLELFREEHASRHLDVIEGSLDRMESLIEELLTLSREGERVRELEAVRLAEAVDAAWGSVESTNDTLVIETDARIRADRGGLRQLLENVMRNAIEHTNSAVTIRVGDLDGGFYVEDDGAGIPPEMRESVFDRGYTTSPTGTGFGLAIVDQIADAHAWSIRVANGAQGGARFEFTDIEPAVA